MLGSTAPKALVKQVEGLMRGLPAEDELSMLLSWLGKCSLVHKLDQMQTPPRSHATLQVQVPDLLAVFEHGPKTIPALIEVKTTYTKPLEWSADYFMRLWRYARLVRLPILVAWKYKAGGFWTLCELRHFRQARKRYSLDFQTAMKQNLLGLLAGDISYSFEGGFGMHLLLEKLAGQQDDGSRFRARISKAFFETPTGQRLTRIGSLWPLFARAEPEEAMRDEAGLVHLSFTTSPDGPSEFLHRAFPFLLSFPHAIDQPVPWRALLETHKLPKPDGPALKQEIRQAIGTGVIRHVFNQRPQAWPRFIPRD